MLKRSATGPEILSLKDKFRSLNIMMTGSDVFDHYTEAAVRYFQSLNGLTKDGIVGPRTLAMLDTATPLPTAVNPISWIANTPYLSQRDNEHVPAGTCNVTALAMVLAFHGLKVDEGQLEDALFEELESKEGRAYFEKNFPTLVKQGYNARNVHGMLGWLAKKHGFQWKYTEGLSWKDMSAWAKPMITSGAFTGSGHVVCITGMTICSDLVIHDPYGDWNTQYKNRDGEFRVYNKEDMEQILSGTSKTLKRIHRIWK